jgi:hypothetical protein
MDSPGNQLIPENRTGHQKKIQTKKVRRRMYQYITANIESYLPHYRVSQYTLNFRILHGLCLKKPNQN